MEGPAKAAAEEQFVRTPKTADQARDQVRQLKAAGVDAIKAVLESGRTGMLFARMDLAMFRAVVDEAGRQGLPSAVHTGSARDVEDAVDAGASSIEHGSFSDAIPDALFARMARAGIAYDPTLAVLEGIRDLSAGRTDLLRRPLVQQAVSQKLLTGTADAVKSGKYTDKGRAAGIDGTIAIAQDNLRRAWKAGVPLVTAATLATCWSFTVQPCIASCSCGWRPAFHRRSRCRQQPRTQRNCSAPTRASAASRPGSTPTSSSSTAIPRAISQRPSASRRW
jgi:imidazolonepropionase-like amidohydrolase